MEHKMEITSQFLRTLYFTGQILYAKHRLIMNEVISCLIIMSKCFEKRKYKVLNAEESIFLTMFDKDEILSQRNNIILINNCEFETYHYKWSVINFYTRKV